jgi:spore germination protein GerM
MTPRHRTRRSRAVLATSILALAGAGCGVASQPTARRTAADDVPFGLLEAPSPSDPVTVGAPVAIYLVREGRLVAVDRALAPEAPVGRVLRALSEGPTSAEQALGIGSPLPPDQIADVTTVRGVALVDLKTSFADLPSEDQALAIGQIVYTLTGRPGIGRVSFTLDGEAIEVPSGDGALTSDALAREDFPDLAPR